MTLRARLTILYAVTFAAGGLVVVAISYLLVAKAPAVSPAPNTAKLSAAARERVADPKFQATCEEAKRSGYVDPNLALKCQLAFQQGVKIGAKTQRDDTLARLPVYALATVALATALATLAGWLLAGRVLRPLAKITEAAKGASQTTLSHRLTLPGRRDELRRLADTFDDMFARLDASFESQRSFIANAGHELRTPLSVARTTVDVVLAKAEPSVLELAAMGQDVRSALDRAEAILAALLMLARTERELTAPVLLELATLAQDIVDATDPGGLRVSTDLKPAPVQADPVLMERMVSNLVDNAVRYNRPGGEVSITTSSDGRRALLTVANSGPVIAQDVAGTLFQPFRRLDQRTATEGLGLGLALVASIVRAHQGVVNATSRPGGGLQIVVELPAAAGARNW